LVGGGTALALVAGLLIQPGCKSKPKAAGEAPVATQQKTAGGGTGEGATKAGPAGAPVPSASPKGMPQATGGAKIGSPGGTKAGR